METWIKPIIININIESTLGSGGGTTDGPSSGVS